MNIGLFFLAGSYHIFPGSYHIFPGSYHIFSLIDRREIISDTPIPISDRYEAVPPSRFATAGILIRYADVIPNNPPMMTADSHMGLLSLRFL